MKYYMEKYLRDMKRNIPPVGEYPGDERTFTPEELEAVLPEDILKPL